MEAGEEAQSSPTEIEFPLRRPSQAPILERCSPARVRCAALTRALGRSAPFDGSDFATSGSDGNSNVVFSLDKEQPAHGRRSAAVSFGRFLAERLRTPIWCRRAMFSNSSTARERNIEPSVERRADKRISIG